MAPPLSDDGVVAPLKASIFASSVPILSVTLIWLAPVAPLATNVRVWPSTVIVLAGGPAVNPVAKVSPPPTPFKVVLASMLLPPAAVVTAPVVVASVYPVAAVSVGLSVKSSALRPPRAVMVPLGAVLLTAVVGVDGKLAA